MKIENAPTLYDALSPLIALDSSGGMSVGDLHFDYMQIEKQNSGRTAICRWDGDLKHIDQFFDEAAECLGDILQSLYDVDDDAIAEPLHLLLHSIKEDAKHGMQPARIYARKDADHWVFTAFQAFEDSAARIWVGAGAYGPAVEQVMIAINKFAEESSLSITQVNAQ